MAFALDFKCIYMSCMSWPAAIICYVRVLHKARYCLFTMTDIDFRTLYARCVIDDVLPLRGGITGAMYIQYIGSSMKRGNTTWCQVDPCSPYDYVHIHIVH